jgi:hypothetical protein
VTVTEFSSAVAPPVTPIVSKNLFAEATAADMSTLGLPLRNDVTCWAPALAAFSAASVASARAAIIRPPSNAKPAHATNVIVSTTTKPEIDPRSLGFCALMESSKHQLPQSTMHSPGLAINQVALFHQLEQNTKPELVQQKQRLHQPALRSLKICDTRLQQA